MTVSVPVCAVDQGPSAQPRALGSETKKDDGPPPAHQHVSTTTMLDQHQEPHTVGTEKKKPPVLACDPEIRAHGTEWSPPASCDDDDHEKSTPLRTTTTTIIIRASSARAVLVIGQKQPPQTMAEPLLTRAFREMLSTRYFGEKTASIWKLHMIYTYQEKKKLSLDTVNVNVRVCVFCPLEARVLVLCDG